MKLDALPISVPANAIGSPSQARLPAQTDSSQAAEEQQQQPSREVDEVQLLRAAKAIYQKINAVAPNLRFSVDNETGKTVVRVVDVSTGETIRQMPSEEVLAISRSIDRLQGLLLNGEG